MNDHADCTDLREVIERRRHEKSRTKSSRHEDESNYETDHDTDSVASSVSVSSFCPKTKCGVSPLNRHRLARRPGEKTMEVGAVPPPALLSRVSTTYFLRSALAASKLERHDTVEMQSQGEASSMQRMDTMGRWENWRGEYSAQGPVRSNRKKNRINPAQRMHAKSPKPDNYAKFLTNHAVESTTENQIPRLTRGTSKAKIFTKISPELSRDQSTTVDLRLRLCDQSLDDSIPKPATEQEAGLFLESGARGRLKRKATTLLSPVNEEPNQSKGKLPSIKKSLKKGLSKKVLIMTPDEEAKTTPSLKRQSTARSDDSTEARQSNVCHKAKRLCVAGPKSQSARNEGVLYIPNHKQWPVEIDAPCAWHIPLSDGESGRQGSTVYVDQERCLIGLTDGTVVELDSSVSPTREYKLMSGVRCLLPDSDFLYAGCQDGGLYDITHDEPRLISHIKGFGQLLSVGVYDGLVAVSDQHGNVALINHRGDILWRQKSRGEFGWMLSIDASGIYHGHSKGLTKYSLDKGAQMWHVDTQEPVFHGVLKKKHIFVAVGHLIQKVDKNAGIILATYDKGKSWSTIIHSIEAEHGLLMAGGKHIVFYDEQSGDVVYVLKNDFKPKKMQYFEGRLICIGPEKVVAIDLTESTILQALNGEPMLSTEVSLTTGHQVTPLKRAATISSESLDSATGILIECQKPHTRRGPLLVKAISSVKNKLWPIQLPAGLQQAGARYIVDELRPCSSGSFYRVYGDIKQVEGS